VRLQHQSPVTAAISCCWGAAVIVAAAAVDEGQACDFVKVSDELARECQFVCTTLPSLRQQHSKQQQQCLHHPPQPYKKQHSKQHQQHCEDTGTTTPNLAT
jgi:hypothetical protein